MSAHNKGDDPLAPPHTVYNIYVWVVTVGGLVTLGTLTASWFFDEAESRILARIIVGAIVAGYLILEVARRNAKGFQSAERALSAGNAMTNEHGKVHAREVRQSARRSIWLIGILSGCAVIAAAALAFRPVYKLFYTKAPKELLMESFAYFDVGSHASLLREAPFLEAITGYLKDEGKAEGARTQIIVIKSKAFEHPTTAFRSSLVFDSKAYVVSGYAFVRHNDGRPVFEPLEVSYAQSGRLTIAVSPSSQGNDLLFVGRLTLLPKAEFPRSLATELQMVLSNSGG